MTTAGEVIVDGLVPADVAFAVPIAAAAGIAERIASGVGGPGVRLGGEPFLGVRAVTYAPQVPLGPPPNVAVMGARAAPVPIGPNSEVACGALVVRVIPTSPAAAVGLTTGDVITELGGRQVGSAAALARALSSHRPGERVQVGWVDPAAFSRSAPVLLSGGPAS